MTEKALEIDDLHVAVGSQRVVQGTDLTINKGELHVLFGPNGSGKSTLLSAIMQLPGYLITSGRISINGVDIAGLTTDAVARLGVGLSFQHPPNIHGVTLERFLQAINRSPDIENGTRELGLEPFLSRDLNVGFSGGELKRAEILKLYAQAPDLLLIDEPESGVDIENIAVIARALNKMIKPPRKRNRSALIITHTGHILNKIQADVGHVFLDGKIVYTGEPGRMIDMIKKRGFREGVALLKAGKGVK